MGEVFGFFIFFLLSEPRRPPEAFPTFQKFLRIGRRGWGQSYIDPGPAAGS